jgi:hypothetical protein
MKYADAEVADDAMGAVAVFAEVAPEVALSC